MLRNRNGNVAIVFALLAPVLIGVVGAGIDFAQYNQFKAEMQEIADSAAIAGARSYSIAGDNKKIPRNVARDLVAKKLTIAEGLSEAISDASANDQEKSVLVKIKHSFTPSFMTALVENPIEIEVDSRAEAVGSANICIIALEGQGANALLLNKNASLTGNDCAVYSNSLHTKAIAISGNASVATALNCSAGGYEGSALAFKPPVITDCPPREDPLEMLVPPASGGCSPAVNVIRDIITTISPGVFCSGLTISGKAEVEFNPGIYFFRGSDLVVQEDAIIRGDGVAFIFEGENAGLSFSENTTIDLSGPENGPMAGVLLFQGSNVANPLNIANPKDFLIRSNNAHTLVGTIYLPEGNFIVDSSMPVAASSAYTAIIAKKVKVLNAGSLVLNSDYAATDVPIPGGLVGASAVRLRN